MSDTPPVLRLVAIVIAACGLIATLLDRHPAVDRPIGLICVLVLLAFGVGYLTKGKRAVGGALDRNAWMPASWRNALFGSTGKREP